MTMQAVKLLPETVELITKTLPSVNVDALNETMIEDALLGTTRFFIPYYVPKHHTPDELDWVMATQEYMDEEFTYDTVKIETEFVEITRK